MGSGTYSELIDDAVNKINKLSSGVTIASLPVQQSSNAVISVSPTITN
jgi:hypothetical protein